MTPQELQSLRNLGGECGAAADEIERLREELAAARRLLNEAQGWLGDNDEEESLVRRIKAELAKDAP